MNTPLRCLMEHALAAVVLFVLFSSSPMPAAANTLLVGDYATGQILRYDADTGAFLGIFASSSQLAGPVSLTFGPDGNLYVAGEISGNVTRFDGQTGAFIGTFIPNGTGGLGSAHGVTFGPDGTST
jgi:outer membrane protein assembly factor BamB